MTHVCNFLLIDSFVNLGFCLVEQDLFRSNVCLCWLQMIDDQDLGFIVNSLGIFIFGLVIAYHYVAADPKYEAT